jgi:sirohydrochlorin cobaltochelatase
VRGIVLFAHGARDPEWARPFEAIRDRIRAKRPEFHVELAYLEMMTPTLEEAIAALVQRGAPSITVYPLFMGQGGHLKNDLPKILDAIRASHAQVPISLESAIGEVPEILDSIAGWILEESLGYDPDYFFEQIPKPSFHPISYCASSDMRFASLRAYWLCLALSQPSM